MTDFNIFIAFFGNTIFNMPCTVARRHATAAWYSLVQHAADQVVLVRLLFCRCCNPWRTITIAQVQVPCLVQSHRWMHSIRTYPTQCVHWDADVACQSEA